MTKRTNRAVSKQTDTPGSSPNTLESITGDDAIAILKVLAACDRRVAERIEVVAKERLRSVEMVAVAANVMMELESLNVEDAWDSSGRTREGYVEPGEAAWEMLEETLRPFRDDVAKYQRLSMLREAELVCQGILKGIYDFEQECASEFKELAADAPAECFVQVLGEWKRLVGRRQLARMTEFLTTHCAEWAEWAVRSQRPTER